MINVTMNQSNQIFPPSKMTLLTFLALLKKKEQKSKALKRSFRKVGKFDRTVSSSHLSLSLVLSTKAWSK